MAVVDRNRVARLIELAATEKTLKGPERLLREEDVRLFVRAAYDDATDAGRAEFMTRIEKMPTAAWPWSAVQTSAPAGSLGGGGGGIKLAVAVPVFLLAPPALILVRNQAESADIDPGNRLPDRGTSAAAEWEPLYKALDTWNTGELLKAIGPQGWVSMLGSSSGQVPKDTGATSGAPAGGKTPGPVGDVPAPQPTPTPTEWWKHPIVIAAGAATVVATGVVIYSLGETRRTRRLEDALGRQEELP